jgi:hypothetical protein
MNPACLGDMALDTVVIDGRNGTNEGLTMVEKLMTLEVCVNNKYTTVKLKTIYTPWEPHEFENNNLALDKLLACKCDISGGWNDKLK